MLSPAYLERLPDAFAELVGEAEMEIIRLMARRLKEARELIPSAQWQYHRLRMMGMLGEDILRILSALTGMSAKRLSRLFEQAGEKALASDDRIYRAAGLRPPPIKESAELQSILTQACRQTQGLFVNLTRTTAAAGQEQFVRMLDRVVLEVRSGGMDYSSAIAGAVRELAREGVQAVAYPSGRSDSLDVATRRAVLTGSNQMASQLTYARAGEMGCDLVETTAHAGARPEHARWQGKVFSLSGKSAKYPDFRAGTGYGTGPGLCGWNCRHSFYPYFEGLSVSAYPQDELEETNNKRVSYNGEEMSLYDATQRQRALERRIRRLKREAGALRAAGQDPGITGARLREARSALKDFIAQTGLKRDYSREKV